ncbi:peptide transporter, partial [Francisella tularensis subsp. holarctica]|nr:peptide transporter [Francisella tularensis subsp. holarctica]
CACGVLLALVNIFINKKLFSTIAAPVGKKTLSFKQLVLAIIGIIFFVSVVTGLLYFSSIIIIVLDLAVVMIVGYYINITFQQDKEYR